MKFLGWNIRYPKVFRAFLSPCKQIPAPLLTRDRSLPHSFQFMYTPHFYGSLDADGVIKQRTKLGNQSAMAYLKRLVAGFPPRLPGFTSGQHVGFVVDKAALGQVFSEYFGFPCQLFHQFLHHDNHPPAGTIGLLVAAVLSGPN
jgi:hypothetical protein